MIADGTEEVECLAVVDILRRAGVNTVLVAAKETPTVVGSRGVRITADSVITDTDMSDGDAIFLPGGMPGAAHLSACEPLMRTVGDYARDGKIVAAICAAPAVALGSHGLLRGKRATCYPGYEKEMTGATISTDGVVTDGNIVTARGLGFALELGFELARLLVGNAVADSVKSGIQYRY